MKIAVVGFNGMLGTDMFQMLEKHHNVIGVDIQQLDITKIQDVMAFIEQIKPDTVINCAAYTNVNGCETEIDVAYKVNALGPKNLSIACNEYQATLVHFSTDYVFDGKKGDAYIESDFVNPLSVYGKSKLEGEENIKSLTNRYYIIRTQWLYGKNGKNFVKTMLSLAKERKEIKVVNDQFGSPTYTKDLCAATEALIQTKSYGTYHITNNHVMTWCDFAKEIFKQASVSGVTVTPCTTEEFPSPAVRPAYSPLKNYYWELTGHEPMRSTQEALVAYLKEENIII